MTSMAAALAASLPAPVVPTLKPENNDARAGSSVHVPQRMEGLIDPEGVKPIERVALGSLVSGNNRSGEGLGAGAGATGRVGMDVWDVGGERGLGGKGKRALVRHARGIRDGLEVECCMEGRMI